MKDSPAVAIALAHIDAWSRHDWDKTRELLAPDIHAFVASTQPQFGGSGSEFTGFDNYMARKTKAAQLIDPGSVEVLSTIGDQTGAVVTVTFRVRLGPGATMVTMARACVYSIDDNQKIKEGRDVYFVFTMAGPRIRQDDSHRVSAIRLCGNLRSASLRASPRAAFNYRKAKVLGQDRSQFLASTAAFSAFNGGNPNSTLDPTTILAVEWQLSAPSSKGCTADFSVENVAFY